MISQGSPYFGQQPILINLIIFCRFALEAGARAAHIGARSGPKIGRKPPKPWVSGHGDGRAGEKIKDKELPMFIQTEQTPNPATLKFLPGRTVLESRHGESSPMPNRPARSPLAERLFEVEGVIGVFFGTDFVSVTKQDEREWYLMKPAVLGVIMEHFTSGRAVLNADAGAGDEGHSGDAEDDEVVSQIKELLDTVCARRSPRTAATSSSAVSTRASSICTCKAPVRVVPARPRP